MAKRAFILCSPSGDAIIHNGKVTCKSADGLKVFTVESDLFENEEQLLITVDGTVYRIPTDEYIPVDELQASWSGSFHRKLSKQQREATCERFGYQRWSVPATRRFIKLLRQYGEDNEQHGFETKRVMWRHIAEQMARSGYQMDENQAENRLKSLHRAYRNSRVNQSTAKKSRLMRHFERDLHELFANKLRTNSHLFIELLDGTSGDTKENVETDTIDIAECCIDEEEATESFSEQGQRDETIPSPETCQSLLSTVNEMESIIYTLSLKIDEESWSSAELLHDVRRLAEANGLLKSKLTNGAAQEVTNWID